MARKPVLIISAVIALATAGAVGASVSAWAGDSSTPAAAKPAPPLHPTTANGTVRPYVAATNVHCGEVVIASVTLNGDLFCPGNGLTIAKASVILNLNGHTIGSTTPEQGEGVRIQTNSDIVENGVTTGFLVGVCVCVGEGSPASDTVTKIRATYNNVGIDDEGTKSKITSNTVYANQIGIAVGGSAATVSNNIATSNAQEGLNISAVATIVSSNEADGNGINGIRTFGSTGTTLTANVANFNVDDGIVNSDRDAIDGGGNLAKGNDTATGVAPEQCSAIACS